MTNGASHFRLIQSDTRSRATDEYLRLIFELGDYEDGTPRRVTTSAIASALNVRPASVTKMLQRLASHEPALVDYQKRQGALLTESGRQAALKTIRIHRLLEQFLYRVMEFPWDEVHREALRLQHAVSPEFVERMAELLGHPEYDPHGAPIPDRALNLAPTGALRLRDVEDGAVVEIVSVPDDDPKFLRLFAADGLVPGRVCQVVGTATNGSRIRWRAPGSEDTKTVNATVAAEIVVRRR